MSVRILTGDCRELLRTLDAASIDSVITDPPYGIGFMGRGWDTFAPARVAALDRRRERKGTERPSATYPGKMGIRSQGGGPSVSYDESRSGNQRFQTWTEEWARECLRVLKPGGHMLVFGGTRTYHRVTSGIEDAGFEIRDCLMWLHGSGFPKSHNLAGDWQGWGTALKPGWEPIILARKPFKGTVAANVLEHGTGAINIDACRLSGNNGRVREGEPSQDRTYRANGSTDFTGEPGPRGGDPSGRWPANVLLDEDASALLDAQSGVLTSGANPTRRGTNKFAATYGTFVGQAECTPARGKDVGGASRFYYVAKASRSERNAGLDDLAPKPLNWSSGDQNPGSFQSDGTNRTSQNHHPTVKPIALMRWLVRLVTPPGGVVLDVFGGSGTTGVACVAEGVGAVLIEREPEYVEIAQRRIAHAQTQGRQPELEGIA